MRPDPGHPSTLLRQNWTGGFPEAASDYEAFVHFYDALFSADDDDATFWIQEAAGARSIGEIGCGNGRLTEQFASIDGVRAVVGVDPSAAMLSRVPRSPKATYIIGSLESIPAYDGQFDLTVCPRGAVSHVIDTADLMTSLEELARVTQPGGRIMIDVPRYATARSTRDRYRRLLKKRAGDTQYTFSARTRTDLLWAYIETAYLVKMRGPEGVVTHEATLRTRIFTLPELLVALSGVGLRPIKAYGDYDARLADDSARRLIITALR